jgi:hypothetical protein
LICRLTVDGVLPNCRAASEKLPASTTRANTAISGNDANKSVGFTNVIAKLKIYAFDAQMM